MKIWKWLKSLVCLPLSSKLKGSKRLKGESQTLYRIRIKRENKLVNAYIKGEIYKQRRGA